MDSKAQPQFGTLTAPGGTPKITSIFDFSAEALGELRLWLEQNPPAIGISNILGFSQFTAQPATTISVSESTTSATYTDLLTVGPALTGLPDGKYMLIFGGLVTSSAAGSAWMAPQINATAASDTNGLSCGAGTTNSGAFACTVTLSGGSNTITMKYRTDSGATGTYTRRWLIALRYANK